MAREFVNNYSDTLATPSVGAGDTSFDVSAATPLGTLAAGEFYTLTLTDDLTSPTKTEIVKCTAISGNTLTVERAQEGTIALAWVSGDNIELRPTAAGLNDKADLSGEAFSVKSLSAEAYEAPVAASAVAYDYANGELQYTTLTEASVVLSVASGIPVGGVLCIVLIDADTYAPDVSAMTPWRDGTSPTYDTRTRIFAERLPGSAAGVYHYSFGGSWAA